MRDKEKICSVTRRSAKFVSRSSMQLTRKNMADREMCEAVLALATRTNRTAILRKFLVNDAKFDMEKNLKPSNVFVP